MKKYLAEHTRLFLLSIFLFTAGVVLVWNYFMPLERPFVIDDSPNPVIQLTDEIEKYSVNVNMQVLSDPGGIWNDSQIQLSSMDERFVPASGRSAFGLDGKTYWIRTTIINHSSLDLWVLRLSNAIVDKMELYADEQSRAAGFENGKRLDDHYWAYELRLPVDQPVTLYIRATTEGSMILPLDLISTPSYHKILRTEYLLFGLYYGFVLLMAAYVFSMYIFMRDSAYIYYSLYIIFFALSQLFWNGLPQELLGEQSGIVELLLRIFNSYEDIFLFFFILCLWFALFFLDKVLQLKTYAPIICYAAKALHWASPLLLLALIFHWPGFSTIAIWYEFIAVLILIAAAFVSVFRGNIAARYIVLGMIAIFGLAAPAVMYTFNLADYNILTHYGYQLGSVAEFIVFTAALSYQTKQKERERIQAQRQMINNQEKLVRTLERWNEELEQTVSERTEKLVQSKRRRNELLQNISHDVRSPLTVVQGGIRAMMLGIQVHPGEQNKHLENLYGKVLYINRFIDDLFELSLDDEEDETSSYQTTEDVHIRQWIEAEFVFLEEFIRIAGLSCQWSIHAASDPIMTINPHDMRRVLTNLVHNACKYSLANKRVTLGATIESDVVIIRIEDEGQGISAEHLIGIFHRSNRGAQSNLSAGKGLGLAISKEIIVQHEGTITAESERGKGSKFEVRLPVSRQQEREIVKDN
ncbi:sensor histidine kinase [Paenibacillus paeoniae]|uniref:histidine kinase n=1 Tax=Paenibacillus paeoniae TaxID=2292705 RepID=A0A371PIX9_9BACL|nr:sensor histidine kinase [Paenibacillus paeoniae]REK75589.1 hypothetical protein DX130_00390 [Paenibacillus paeoniae]